MAEKGEQVGGRGRLTYRVPCAALPLHRSPFIDLKARLPLPSCCSERPMWDEQGRVVAAGW